MNVSHLELGVQPGGGAPVPEEEHEGHDEGHEKEDANDHGGHHLHAPSASSSEGKVESID